MDADRFDSLSRVLFRASSRRGVLGLLMAVASGVAGASDEAAARKRGKRSTRDRDDVTVQGPCGNGGGKANACKRHGQCCTGYCHKKHRCRCKKSGQSCSEDRQCCPAKQGLTCQDGACQPPATCTGTCPGCCDRNGDCQPGTSDAACGSSGACDVCTGQQQCQNHVCVCVPDCAGKACGSDGCGEECGPGCAACEACQGDGICAAPCGGTGCCDGGSCQAGMAADACGAGGEPCTACSNPIPTCVDGDCAPCAIEHPCPGGQVCCDGSCFAGICCADAACAPTGNTCVNHQCQCGGGAACDGATPTCWNGACVCGDVCPSGCQFSAVNTAATNTAAGGTIRICAGTYGGVAFDHELTLLGVGDGDDPASNTILDGQGGDSVIRVFAGVTATLQDLRITGATSGGVNVGAATLTMTGCTVTGNTALVGGGINNNGTLTLKASSITSNVAAFGGGILNNGTVTLDATTVTDNAAVTASGVGGGGGIWNEALRTVNLSNGSSVDGNFFDGGENNCAGPGTYNGSGCA